MHNDTEHPSGTDPPQYDPDLVDNLLTIPPFHRGNWQATLYVARSPKLGVEVTMLGHDRYALWLNLEADPEVSRFSLSAVLACTVGAETISYRPLGAAETTQGQVQIYTTETQAPGVAVAAWVADHGIATIMVNPRELALDTLLVENRKLIIALCNLAQGELGAPLFELLRSHIKARDQVTVGYLVKRCWDIDQTVVLAAIGQMIMHKTIFADIARLPFDPLLTLRA